MPLLVIFVIVPIIELMILLKVGNIIGVIPTIAIILLTAVIGVNLLRVQGLSTLMRASDRLRQGGIPAQELAEGFLLAVAGGMLLTPGFMTDAFGFALLVPSIRIRIAQTALKMADPKMATGAQQSSPFTDKFQQADNPHVSSKPNSGDIIEGEFRRED